MGKSVWENFPQPQCWTSEGSLLPGAASGWDSWTFLDLIWSMIGMRLLLQARHWSMWVQSLFSRTESDWYRLVFMLFSVPFAIRTGDLGSIWFMWSNSSSTTAKLSGQCLGEAVEETRWWEGDCYSWHYMAILPFFSSTFPVCALCSDFWHFSWVKNKQEQSLEIPAAAPGVGTLQHILMWCCTVDRFPWYRTHYDSAVVFSCPWSTSDWAVWESAINF